MNFIARLFLATVASNHFLTGGKFRLEGTWTTFEMARRTGLGPAIGFPTG